LWQKNGLSLGGGKRGELKKEAGEKSRTIGEREKIPLRRKGTSVFYEKGYEHTLWEEKTKSKKGWRI